MEWTSQSAANTRTLDDVVARLSARAEVDGLLTIGSTATGAMTPVSDYDLVIVLSGMPAPMRVGVTWIAGRLADLLFVRAEMVERIAVQGEPVARNAWQGRMVRWLRDGSIRHDRSGALARAAERALAGDLLLPTGADEAYAAWFGAYYNLHQTRRLLRSSDPVRGTTIDLRLLYSLSDLWTGYFLVRGLLWEGEKAAIRYMADHDPAYLALFRGCLAEIDRVRKVELYTRLVHATMAPAGPPWAEGETAFAFEAGAVPIEDATRAAQRFWRDMVGGEPSGDADPASPRGT
jgi:hypothetical protein